MKDEKPKLSKDDKYAVCFSCEHLKVNDIIRMKIKRCGVCGCPIISRVYVGCPINKF